MNGLTRWDPFRELEAVHHRLAGIFDHTPLRGERQEALAGSDWAPLVDISEDDHAYAIKVELPEMKREDIKVGVENGVLSVSGERKQEKEEKNRRFHRVERSYGSFVRQFDLPENADPAQISAEYRDGVLTINVRKSERARPRAIDIAVK